MIDFDIRATIVLPGGNLEIDGPYDFEKTSQETEQQTLRKVTANNRWVEGTFLISAVRDNVREPLSIWVEGDDHTEFDQAMEALKAAVLTKRWQLVVSVYEDNVEKVRRTYSCQASEYTVTTTQEYRMAHMGLLKVDVDRLPQVEVIYP